MLNIGIVGVGFMGWIHFLAIQRSEQLKLKAICSRDAKKRAGDWRGIQGNFGPPGEEVDLTGVAAYESLDELLADDSIDCVDLCLPPHVHYEAALKSLRAGKHVFLEKPMALKANECEEIVAVAESVGKQVMVGHVLPFFPEYIHARKLIDSGEYGALLGGTFKRVISDPQWLDDFYDAERVGGPLLDLHVHDAHLIRLLFGMPTEVASVGRMRGDVVAYCQTQFGFENKDLVVSATSGVINQQGRPFTHGFEIHLERATLHYEFAAITDEAELMPLKIFDDQEQVIRPELPAGDEIDAFVAELEEAAAAIADGHSSTILGGELARDAVILCHRQTESVQQGKPVSIS